MKLDPRSLIAPLVGLLVLVLVVQATMGALKASGAWQPEIRPKARPENPYARLDAILSRPDANAPAEALRDPFGYGAASPTLAATAGRPRRRPPAPPVAVAPEPPPVQPTLTSIIWDEDPRATVCWNGKDFSIRENSLFDDFVVKSIRPDQVVLEHGGQPLVLRLVKKGE